MKKADSRKQFFSNLTGSGSGKISARIRPESDPEFFYKIYNFFYILHPEFLRNFLSFL